MYRSNFALTRTRRPTFGDGDELTAAREAAARDLLAAELAEACDRHHVLPTAFRDVADLAKEGFALNDANELRNAQAQSVDAWVAAARGDRDRRHWFPASVSGGARGNAGTVEDLETDNPFVPGQWNLTNQMKLIRENSARAQRLEAYAKQRYGSRIPAK
jgi:hypothetical protein